MEPAGEQIILPVRIGERRFRVHIGGNGEQLSLVIPQIRELALASTREPEFLKELDALLATHGAILADILDISDPTGSKFDAYVVLRAIAKCVTADVAWRRLKALLETCDEEDLNRLVIPTDRLIFARMYLDSVVRDLDEHTDSARTELRSILPGVYRYLLLDEAIE